MSYDVNDEHIVAVRGLSAGDRYKYTIKKIADWGAVWSLRNEDGWVLYTDSSGKQCFPIWPHSVFATSCAADQWSNTVAEQIDLTSWLARWLPGLTRDKRGVAVFPSERENAVVVDPSKFESDIRTELAKIE